ncbi:MAG: chromosomal replication initiator protein DnaA [Elusimicrobia bacterium HGW-Elusimicrobia-4]|nr:MAG: chromosomal replication initiator protein DnaA [Elusimicrobia bacterium HGW-Elusimicrobia-4]
MIKKWDLMPSPCDRDKSRFKLLISCSDSNLADIVKLTGSDAGKPFTPLSQDYNFAIYIYNLSDIKKSEVEKFLKEKCSVDKIENAGEGNDLEEILEKAAGITPGEQNIPEEKIIEQQQTDLSQPHQKKEENSAVLPPEKKQASEATEKSPLEKTDDLWKPKLNSRYIFDNFVVGSNSRFVYAAAWAASQNPGKTYNPLFIYGGVGLGKTHIMQAIGNALKDRNSSAKVLYITTEKFTAEVIDAIKNGTLLEFREHYRLLDLLLVDDIQFLSEAESTQEEFFHTFDILYENQKQIVMTSDKPPKKLVGIEERLVSRFEWGLIADIKPPDLETRVVILKKDIQNYQMEVDDKILIYIAGKLKSNVRELEGFLKRIKAYSLMSALPITMELAKELMGEILPESELDAIEPPPSALPVVPSEEAKKNVPSAPAFSPPPPPAVKNGYDLLKPVEVAYFYPEKCEKDFEKMKEQFKEAIKNHKLKFRLVDIFEKSYNFDKKINYSFFAQLCKTNNVSIAILLGPPPSSSITEDDFINNLTNVCDANDISAEIIPFADLIKQYKYLNLVLDIMLKKNGLGNNKK